VVPRILSGRRDRRAVVAFIVAVIPIAVQRKFWPTERAIEKKDAFWRWGLGAGLVALVAWMTLAPVQQPAAVAAPIEERTYAVTPASVNAKAGIVTGQVTEMKVAERVEKGSDRIVTAAKLTGMLTLKNTSANQTVRLLEGRLRYIDAQGQSIKLEDARAEPTFKFAALSRASRHRTGRRRSTSPSRSARASESGEVAPFRSTSVSAFEQPTIKGRYTSCLSTSSKWVPCWSSPGSRPGG
jgi:hypothetical protein